MLKWAIIFAVIAIIAGLFGFTGIAAGAAGSRRSCSSSSSCCSSRSLLFALLGIGSGDEAKSRRRRYPSPDTP